MNVLLDRAAEHPDLPALIDRKSNADRVVTFRELAQRVSSGAAYLQSLGLKKSQTVLVFQPVSIELYEILLSAFHAGLRVMLADPSAGSKFISLCCQRSMPDAFFGPWKAHAFRFAVPELRKVKVKIRSDTWFPRTHPWKTTGALSHITEVPSNHPALITFTSGSTGIPKAAVRTHEFLLAQHHALSEAMDFQPEEIDLITLPVFVLANLASGMTSVLADTDLGKPGSPNHAAILRQCETFAVTRCAASPAFFEALSGNLPQFKKIFTGGAPVFPDLLHRMSESLPHAEIFSVYGSTEAEPISHLPAKAYDSKLREITRQGGGLCVGEITKQLELKIITNHSGEKLARLDPSAFLTILRNHNELGEIIVSGRHVLTGYLDGLGDEETKIHVDGKIWHRTGDAGWIDSQDRVWLLGRASEMLVPFPSLQGLPEEALRYPFAIECAIREIAPHIRTAALNHNGLRTLVVGELSPNPEIDAVATKLGIETIIRMKRIPLDRRHNAKIDYPVLRMMLKN